MQISRKNVLKATLATLGAIFVGAIGSGVWQELLAPGLRATRNWILDLVSFVSRSFKDDIYAQVARDQSDMANLETLFLVTVIYIALCIMLAIYFSRRLKDLQGRHERLVGKVQGDLEGNNEPEMTPEQFQAKLKELGILLRRGSKYMYLTFAAFALIITIRVIQLARISYINSALSHYHVVLRIASPFLTPTDKLSIESKFAQIRDKQEYVEIVNQLSAVAKEHGQSVPGFHAW